MTHQVEACVTLTHLPQRCPFVSMITATFQQGFRTHSAESEQWLVALKSQSKSHTSRRMMRTARASFMTKTHDTKMTPKTLHQGEGCHKCGGIVAASLRHCSIAASLHQVAGSQASLRRCFKSTVENGTSRRRGFSNWRCVAVARDAPL